MWHFFLKMGDFHCLVCIPKVTFVWKIFIHTRHQAPRIPSKTPPACPTIVPHTPWTFGEAQWCLDDCLLTSRDIIDIYIFFFGRHAESIDASYCTELICTPTSAMIVLSVFTPEFCTFICLPEVLRSFVEVIILGGEVWCRTDSLV